MPVHSVARREWQGRHLERLARESWRGAGGMRGLSKQLGISRATLYSWFRGDTSPNANALARLAAILDVAPAELIGSPAPESRGVAEARSLLAEDSFGAYRRVGQITEDQEVTWCDADDAIGPAAHRMYQERFSQMPVRDRGQWVAVLTEETIARWMAGRSRHGLHVDERAPVREVLAYSEDPDNFEIASPEMAAADVLARFNERATTGRPLAAVLVLDGGRPDGDILGIVTPWDIPRLSAGGAR